VSSWTKESIRSLRLRLGWSQSDLARRLHCQSEFIEDWESGKESPESSLCQELELISHQAEACSDDIQNQARAEKMIEEVSLSQIRNDGLEN
jgi:DNA-binding transcriptional regulator YiaG